MTQDYSVEICGSEQPDAATSAGWTQAAGADEVADRGGGAVAEVGRGFGGGQEGGGDAICSEWHSWFSPSWSPALPPPSWRLARPGGWAAGTLT